MLRAALLGLLVVTGATAAAAPIGDPWKNVAFDRVARAQVRGVQILGISTDGKRYAYVDCEVIDGSGFLTIAAAVVEIATGRIVANFKLEGNEPGSKENLRLRKKYDAFLERARKEGITYDPAQHWQKQAGRFVSPDGKLALRWRAGRPRAGAGDADPHGRTFTAMLEDLDANDHAALFELYAGYGADQVTRKEQPFFGEIYGAGDAFVMTITSIGKAMCWDSDDHYVQAFSLPALRVARPARELNNAGMAAYHAGQLEDAQAIFRAATMIDPGGSRARYNLAAIAARRGDDETAISALTILAKSNLTMVRWKLLTDEDFVAALKRPGFFAAMVKVQVLKPSEAP